MEEIVNKNNEIVLFNDVCNIIDQTRNKIAVYVNTEVCLTNWYVGKRIKEDVLYNQRAEYGKQILKNLSKRLTEQYGSGWSIYKLQHCVRAAYTFTEDEIVYACQKLTWPMEYEREEYENVPARNPFCPGFYHSGNPWLATFSLATGRLTGRYGELGPCARISRTGYAYVSPLMRTCGNELVYTDRYSGTIHITDNLQDNDNAVYSAFSVDTAKFPQPDTAKFYTAEYSNEYDKFFYRCITDVQIDDSNVYCIVKYSSGGIYSSSPDDNDFTLVTIDRSTGMATELQLPHADGWQTMGFGLRTSSGRVTPFGFYRRADGGYVVREWTGCN